MTESAEWIRQISEGTASPQLKEMASRGQVPFTPAEMALTLTLLAADGSETIARQARQTLAGLPRQVILQVLEDRGAQPAMLNAVAASFPADEEILARLAGHPSLSADLFAGLCDSSHPEVLEALAGNQARLRRGDYGALMRLIANPALPARLKGYLMEELARQRAALKVPAGEDLTKEIEAPEVRFDEVLVKEFEEEDAAVPVAKRQQIQEHRHKSIYQIIRSLNTGEKLILAMKGNKEARYLLARDSNKLVATKVLESPRLTESEVEMFAKMTNVCDELLRGIARKKEWMGKYNIVKALALNPKTPVALSLPMINKLTVRDLSLMARNRNIPEVIRNTAARLYRQRKAQRSGG